METFWILAIDVGMEKTGIAVAQSLTKSGRPLAVLRKEAGALRPADFAPYLAAWPVRQILIGKPALADGRPHFLIPHIDKLAKALQDFFQLPIFFIGEYLTSQEAINRLGKRKDLDAMAALIMAEDYLNNL